MSMDENWAWRRSLQEAAAADEPECDCLVPWLEGAGNHSPGCAIFRRSIRSEGERPREGGREGDD